MKGLVSIIVPLYNSEPFLDQLNISISNQTYSNIEIIYVNDGSPDQSLSVVKEFHKADSRIKIIDKPNGGQAAALNDGIKFAKGKYLMFLDADDTLALTACERAVNIMEQNAVDMVFWLHTREFRSQNRSEKGPTYFPEEKHFNTEQEMVHLRRRMIGLLGNELSNPIATDYFNAGWGKLYRSSLIKENNIRWTDTKLVGSSDVLFNAQLMPHIRSAYYLPTYLLHYTKDNYGSLTKKYGWSLFEKMKRLHEELEKIVKSEYRNLPEFKEALSNRRALSLINLTLSVSRYPFHPQSIQNMKAIISNEKYKKALYALPLNLIPLHYRFFFIAARFNFILVVLFMGTVMRLLR